MAAPATSEILAFWTHLHVLVHFGEKMPGTMTQVPHFPHIVVSNGSTECH